MWKSISKSIIIALIIFFIKITAVSAMEYIDEFQSDIEVKPDGSLLITETIAVYHEGREVKRGIYRDLSTAKGENYDVLFVLRNNKQEPWFVERVNNKFRINTGNDTFLESPALSVYTISYIMYDALRPIKSSNLNELYLNVTGRWSLPINKLDITVTYPPQTEIVKQYSYETNRDTKQYTPGEKFSFTNLSPMHEITIAQSFIKGTVNIPLPKIWRWIIASFIATLIYFLIVWSIWGKDPEPHPIVPDWQVPQKLTPLECAYIEKKGAQPSNAFFLHIIWLLNQKIISVIEQDAPAFLGKKKTYTLTTNQTDTSPENEEAKTYLKEFPNVLTLTSSPSYRVGRYEQNLCKKITTKMENKYYRRRNILTIIGALIFPLIWINIFPETAQVVTYILIFILPKIMSRSIYVSLLITIIIVIFLFTFTQNPLITGIFGSYLLTISIFQYLMFQPTIVGQRQKEKIEGLKMFLSTITSNDIAIKEQNKSPLYRLSKDKRLTPEDMENLFPYAVALGIEKAWEKKYASVFGTKALSQFTQQHNFTDYNFRTRLSDSCTQTAHLPSTSSSGTGSSGGGFSGGGFGGGGGGGR